MIGVVMIMTIKTPGLSYVHQIQNESPRRKNYKTQKIEDAYDPYHKPVIFKISCLAKKALFFFPRIYMGILSKQIANCTLAMA